MEWLTIFFFSWMLGQVPESTDSINETESVENEIPEHQRWLTTADRVPKMVTIHDPNGVIQRYQQITGENGLLTQNITFSIDGNVVRRETFEYDNKGRMLKETRFQGMDTLEYVNTLERRRAHILGSEIINSLTGQELQGVYIYTDGLLTERAINNRNLKLRSEVIRYDLEERIQEIQFYDSEGSGRLAPLYKWNYNYDLRNRITYIEQTSFNDILQEYHIYWYPDELGEEIMRIQPVSMQETAGMPTQLPFSEHMPNKRLQFHTILWVHPTGSIQVESAFITHINLAPNTISQTPINQGWYLNDTPLQLTGNNLVFQLNQSQTPLYLRNTFFNLVFQLTRS